MRRFDWVFASGWLLIIGYLLGVWTLAVISLNLLVDPY